MQTIIGKTSTDKLPTALAWERIRYAWLSAHWPDLNRPPPRLPPDRVAQRWWESIGKSRRGRYKVGFAAMRDHILPKLPRGQRNHANMIRVWRTMPRKARAALKDAYEGKTIFEDIGSVLEDIGGVVVDAIETSVDIATLPAQTIANPKKALSKSAKYLKQAAPLVALAVPGAGPALGMAAMAASLADRAARGDVSAVQAVKELGSLAAQGVPEAQQAVKAFKGVQRTAEGLSAADSLAQRAMAAQPQAQQALSSLLSAARRGNPQAKRAAGLVSAARKLQRQRASAQGRWLATAGGYVFVPHAYGGTAGCRALEAAARLPRQASSGASYSFCTTREGLRRLGG